MLTYSRCLGKWEDLNICHVKVKAGGTYGYHWTLKVEGKNTD
jgi:hypothetical protein